MISEEKIYENWNMFLKNIETYISGDRKKILLDFYNKNDNRFVLMPCSTKKHFHSCFPGGYVEHVNRVLKLAFEFSDLWKSNGGYIDYSDEELAMVVINHDLGKFGDDKNEFYINQTSQWHKENRGELYTINPEVSLMHLTDRSFFILQELGIKLSYNEYIGIKNHDGLYDKANEFYYLTYSSTLPTNLPYVVSQADLAASKIEYDIYVRNTKGDSEKIKRPSTNTSTDYTLKEKNKISKEIIKKSKTLNNFFK